MNTSWRCWYDDGIDYDSVNDQFIDMPEDGFQIRMLYYDEGRQIQMGMDYYYEAQHSSGIIYGTNNSKEEIEERYESSIIKRGRWAPDEFYQELIKTAMDSKAP